MKQIFTFLLTVITLFASGQNLISPVSINLPANPPANTAEWATTLPPVMILAQTKLVNGQVNGIVQESKILVTIKSGGNKVCGTYTPQTAPVSGFNAANKNWTGANVLSLLGQDCTLKPGNYELCVQFYSFDRRIIGESCKPFTIADKKQDDETYSPPQNIFPNNEKSFKEAEVKAAVIFRWTPVIPKPKEQVTYKLRVWQLMQGQNGAQAMRSNPPIVTKDVDNITQAVVTNLYTGPCKPPYLCDYVWAVQATGKEAAQAEPKNYGTSGPTSFSVASSSGCSHTAVIKSIECLGIVNGLQQYKVCVDYKNTATIGCSNCTILLNTPNNYPSIGGGGVTIVSTNPSTVINTILPTVPPNLTAGIQTSICFNATVAAGNNLKFQIHATCNDGQATLPEIDRNHENSIFDTIPPSCRCNLCDSNVVKWEIQSVIKYDSTATNNVLTLHNDVSFSPYNVVKLSTEIVDFYWYTEGDCKKCNNNDYYFGNLVSGTISGTNFTNAGTSVAGPGGTPIPSSHQIDFIANSLAGTHLSNDVFLNISLPPQTQLSCCTDCFRFCIRYTVTFMQGGVCKTCSIVKCYESKRKHRKVGLQQQVNQCGESGVIIDHNGGGTKKD